jgi:hypothetical protein
MVLLFRSSRRRKFPHIVSQTAILSEKNKSLNIKCVISFALQLLSETILILRRIRRHVIADVPPSSCSVPVTTVNFNETSIFYSDLRKILKHKTSWNSVQWQPNCSTRTDGQTDRHEARNFTIASNKFQSHINNSEIHDPYRPYKLTVT